MLQNGPPSVAICDFRGIAVGADLSEGGALTAGSRLAVEQARWVAKLARAQLTVVHSTRREEHWSAGEGAFGERDLPVREACGRSLDAVIGSLREDGIDARLVVSDERAWLAIVEQALRADVNLSSQPRYQGIAGPSCTSSTRCGCRSPSR